METLIEINVFLFLATVTMVTLVVKYRIHLHVEYRVRKVRGRRITVTPQSAEPPAASPLSKDLISALKNLGASPNEAREMAAQAFTQGPADLDTLILRALQGRQERQGRPNPRRESR